MATPTPKAERTASARRWYQAAVVFSVLGLIFDVVSHLNVRLGYPLAFVFSMWGVLAVTRPAWDRRDQRIKVIVVNTVAFVALLMVMLHVGGSGA